MESSYKKVFPIVSTTSSLSSSTIILHLPSTSMASILVTTTSTMILLIFNVPIAITCNTHWNSTNKILVLIVQLSNQLSHQVVTAKLYTTSNALLMSLHHHQVHPHNLQLHQVTINHLLDPINLLQLTQQVHPAPQ